MEGNVITRLRAWVDAGHVSGTGDVGTLIRVRILHICAGFFLLWAPVYVIRSLHHGLLQQALVLTLVSANALGAILFLARRGRPEMAGHLVTAGLMGLLFSNLFDTGGMRQASAVWLTVVPLCAGLLVGPRGALPWGLATLVGTFALWGADAFLGVVFVDPLPPESRFNHTLLDYTVILLASSTMLQAYGSAERAMQRDLADANAKLREEVRERSVAQQEANAAAQARTVFLATMSHEIRTPLNGLLGLTDLLRNTDLDPSQREFAEAAHLSSELLHALLDDVLDFSKIDAGELELESIAMDLAEICREVVNVWRRVVAERGIRLELLPLPAGNTWVLGDPTRIRQMLGNLVSNAMKFTERGTIQLGLRVEDGWVDLSVADTGIGMDADAAGRVFDAFRQADSSTTRQYGGSGLGLAICHATAAAMEGEILLDTELGKGSTFTVRIPHRPVERPRKTIIDEGYDITSHHGCRVLVAEDNPVNQMLMRRLLETLGLQVEVVSCGATCVASWKADPPDLILMDCNMPGCDGYEATEAIRAQGGTLPIIALTANTLQSDVDRCFEVGMNAYLSKPVRRETLTHTLATWLDDVAHRKKQLVRV